jgi:tRNA modification GTPase
VHPLDDTIVAIATPPGRGGIGVVRLSGSRAKEIATPLLRLPRELTSESGHPATVFGELIENDGDTTKLDEIVVTYFPKPHSYTTDDVIEISAHGSPVVLRHIVERTIAAGARLAEPGEFTMRAFLNGRIDLTQAEAVRDLIDSQTLFQAKTAAQQLGGALSKRVQPIKKQLVELIATLEAGVDFAEDDVSVLPDVDITNRIAAIRAPLEELAQSFAYGKVVHDGLTLAIVGRPNVGKSSLFNRLVERDRAIVTATPGTTRDLVTETVSIGGIPVKLIDTAGIRAAMEEAESIGIQKSYEALADADLALVVLDSSAGITTEDKELLNSTQGRKTLVAWNKTDLSVAQPPKLQIRAISTSASTGAGIGDLRQAILHEIGADSATSHESGFLTNTRHQALVNESLEGLNRSALAVQNKVPHEMLLLDLYSALRPLDSLTGTTTADDILHLIFGNFCIGK